MHVLNFEHDALEFRACVVLRVIQKPYPHVVGVVVDNKHAAA
jgi:hypothetical protein